MRFSNAQRHQVTDVDPAEAPEAIFERVERDVAAEDRSCLLLLVGGADREHQLLRAAQAHLRFDALPSRWSHAALLTDWKTSWRSAVGLEVTHEPQAPWRHEPSRNGVTPFSLSRYADADRYPNLALLSFTFKPAHARAQILEAALEPNRDRARFPLWRQLGPWLAHFHDVFGESPLARGAAIPSAAYCQYAFEAAGVDAMTAASLPGACPELLWATALRWSEGLEDVTALRVWRRTEASPLAARVADTGSLAHDHADQIARLTSP
jgi:hypothetical protein